MWSPLQGTMDMLAFLSQFCEPFETLVSMILLSTKDGCGSMSVVFWHRPSQDRALANGVVFTGVRHLSTLLQCSFIEH